MMEKNRTAKLNIKNRRRAGFTLVEVLIASFIFLLAITGVYCVYIMILQFVGNTSSQVFLQSSGRLAVDRMARDIRLASDINCSSSGDSIELTCDPTKMGQEGYAWIARYRLVDDEILFNPDIGSSDETVVIDKVDLDGRKLFRYDGGSKLVTIDLRIENTILETIQDSHLTTIVKVRNAY